MIFRFSTQLLCCAMVTLLVSCQLESKSPNTTISIYDPEGGQSAGQEPSSSDEDSTNNEPTSGNPITSDDNLENSDTNSNGSTAPEPPSENYDCETTQVFSEKMVCMHNEDRANALPAPSPALQPVTWNEDLAKIASDYAAACVYAHNDDRSENFNTYVGENIAASYGSPNPEEIAMRNWVEDEIPFYDYADNSCTAGKVCGHYTQVVWRNSLEIGCALQECTVGQLFPNSGSSATQRNQTAYYTVCNYAPGGNNGNRPY